MRTRWSYGVAVCGSLFFVLLPTLEASARVPGGTSAAGTDAASPVAVLPVQSRSTLPDTIRAQLRGTIARGLQRADVALVSDAIVDGEPGAAGCDDARCAGTLAEALGAAWIVQPTITRVDAVYEIRLAAIDRRGQVLASASERCEICGYDEVTELVTGRSAALASKVRLLERQVPTLVVRSHPSGAEVWIDDRRVGHTPLEQVVAAGEHDVRVELRGYASQHRRVTALAGTEDALELALQPKPRPTRRQRVLRGLGGAALGTGAAMLGAGAGLVAIDEREYERRCNPDPLGHCAQRYDTLDGGIALMVGGGALVASGIVAVVAGRRARRSGSEHAVQWRIGRGLAFAF